MHDNNKFNVAFITRILAIFSFTLFLSFYLYSNTSATPSSTMMFGIGPEAVDAINTPLVKESNIKMLTSWYNGSTDLNWMDDSWHTNFIADSYAKGYTHHVITYHNDMKVNFDAPGGSACGRQYPLSAQFISDIEKLTTIYKGNGPIYFTLMTEFQDYTCHPNQWAGNENYHTALKANYLKVMGRIRAINPNAKVSLGWGGWQYRFDNPTTGAGRSLFPYFDDVMKASQFQSFQAMQSDTNLQDIKDMTRALGAYGPVMLAHYKPDNGSQSTFESDLRTILTDTYMKEVMQSGLFAISFMDRSNMDASGIIFSFIKEGVNKFTIEGALQTASIPAPTANPLVTVTAVTQSAPDPALPTDNFSARLWNQTPGRSAGYKPSEWLHCNGYFSY